MNTVRFVVFKFYSNAKSHPKLYFVNTVYQGYYQTRLENCHGVI